jgi:hypothetical protein
MITLRPHKPQDYAILPDMDATDVGVLTESDHACLDDLGNHLLRAGANDRFGATLLHSHFIPESGETLVEAVDTEAQLLWLRPVRNAASDLAAINVRFEDDETQSDDIRLVGLEFVPSENLDGVVPINELDRACLAELRSVLVRHGKTRRFGLRLFHEPLKSTGKILVESFDPSRRWLCCALAKPDEDSLKRAIPTVFRWKRASWDETGLFASQYCEQLCTADQVCGAGDEPGTHIIVQSGHNTQHIHDTGPA